ncbi:DUF1330 domain-containing protein [Streptomyces sp. SID13726]|uniref:DUF1330 domain-containing protein n=1 Tax=Streptomyces sp. SID13726 TaxID=2706058 RepID=UPI0013BDBCD8|nr:DUF1330 domain-containing protein [Streptomyces sp. SID13726]NEB02792.1 DUF1330 domain-containing protein [Streptomyces sp. SID13726]
MPKGYVIITEAISDPAGMAAYGRAAAASIAESGAKVLAADPRPRLLEGEWHGDQTVVLEFPSAEAARAWYESASYEKAKPLRQAAAECRVVIVSGFEMPTPGD